MKTFRSKNIIAQTVYVSNISYVNNDNNEYYVLHRIADCRLRKHTGTGYGESNYNYQRFRLYRNKGWKVITPTSMACLH